jgi:hypothetical protein
LIKEKSKMADKENAQTEAATKAVAEDQKVRARSDAEYAERMKGKPTPTQAENDLGMHLGFVTGSEHEEDGSNPDPHQTRQLEADRPAAKPYQTRQATPARPPTSS